MKLLVADESLFYQKMLKSLLESWGYQVVLAGNGHEAQCILDGDDPPLLAILDCAMPGLGGLELCERIRTRHHRYVYTILLSADDQQSNVLRGFELGADDYLCKPFNQLELRTRLKVGEIVIRSHEDVVEAHEALKFEASHDSLVRIWNHRAIIELLDKELSRAKRSQTLLSILFADLDLIKQVNENYGNLVGDEVLRVAAARMSGAVRHCDHVGRYEGDEFLVVLPNCTTDAAREVAGRVQKSIGDGPIVNEINLTVSIGLSQWHPGQDACDLLRRADVALYRAKQNGRNRIEVENAQEADCL
jgi:diguanylate cyclase (GGDEF)-like protein